MTLMQKFRVRLRLFARDQQGSMPTEGVMAFAFLVWWYIASFQFFDAYRQKNINLKAAYTVADLISREVDPIDANYIKGLNKVFDYLTFSNKPTQIRVTSVYFDTATNSYKVNWSYSTSTVNVAYTNATLQTVKNKIPVLPAGDTVILVQTYMAYEPIFSVGLKAMIYDTFIATRPRAVPCIRWDKKDGSNPACAFS
ncbi:MAG: hypothetical protein N2422_03095 [Rhodobacteraceae bacterium]|nr:hypothetical protein [Paracoccaceae bacterium]